jgi:hypothetical protein
MQKIQPAVLAIVIVITLAVSGCTQTVLVSDTPAPFAANTPMSLQEAGVRYLSTVCAMNDFTPEFTAALMSGEVTTIRAAAEKGRLLYSTAAASLESTNVKWPTEVVDNVHLVSQAFFAYTSYFDQMAHAEELFDMASVASPGQDGAAASQAIRSQLGLGSDTLGSCANR